jgi:hypothetical protein
MLPQRLDRVLLLVHGVGAVTLLRSVLYERWITVVVAGLLLAGTSAARRGKTWGVPLTLGTAVMFLLAGATGIGPAWFGLVAIAAALPFAMTWKALHRFDPAATLLMMTLSTGTGLVAAACWRPVSVLLWRISPVFRANQHVTAWSLVLSCAALAALVSLTRHKTEPATAFGALQGHAPLSRVRVAAPALPLAVTALADNAPAFDELTFDGDQGRARRLRVARD